MLVESGLKPEEYQKEHPDLSLGQIHAAFSYYHDHKEEMDAEIERRTKLEEAMRAEAAESPQHQRLMAKLKDRLPLK